MGNYDQQMGSVSDGVSANVDGKSFRKRRFEKSLSGGIPGLPAGLPPTTPLGAIGISAVKANPDRLLLPFPGKGYLPAVTNKPSVQSLHQ